MKYVFITLFWFCFALALNAQEDKERLGNEVNKDELGNVLDQFQENFFLAITQRAILNHERANEILVELIAMQPDEAVLYVEKAKNHYALQQHEQAEQAYLKSLKILPPEASFDVKVDLLKVYQVKKDYPKALALSKELAQTQASYLVVAANIYMLLQQPNEALQLLNQLEEKQGDSEDAERLREVIYQDHEMYKQAIAYYQKKTEQDTNNVLWYAKLMRFYSLNKQLKKTIQTGLLALEINPFQPDVLGMLSLAYLSENNPEKAIPFIEQSLSHNEVSERNKVLIIQNFRQFVEANPTYQTELIRILDVAIESGETQASNEERGLFLLSQDKEKALNSFLLALQDQPGKLSLIKQVVYLQLELEQYNEAIQVIEEALEIYPMQSELFLLKGKAEAGNQFYQQAIATLEEGLDYLFDLPAIENEFFITLAEIYEAMGDESKADEYRKKRKNNN